MISRTLEPEAMDTPAEADEYDAMDHSAVNAKFVADFLQAHGPCRGGPILDVGTGTARIPIELCQADAKAHVVAADLSEPMLAVGRRNVEAAYLGERIRLALVDAKGFEEAGGTYEAVISNSIIHHIPEPKSVMTEMRRLVAPGGTVFVRDLFRPDSTEEVDKLVEAYTSGETPSARALFEASLRAALTLDEIRSLIAEMGLSPQTVAQTSDRHWTWTWLAPI